MNAQEVISIVGSLGFPIALVLAMLWFFTTKFWPWYIARQTKRDEAEDARHAEYLNEMRQTRTVYEKTVETLDRLSGRLDTMREHEQSEHAEILRAISTRRE